MKRYVLFAGDNYYPAGGANDLKGSFDTIEDAIECAANTSCDWWHVWDITDGQIVKYSRN